MTAKTLFITGASSGIGEATARAAVAQGWNVGLFARRADKLQALAAELGDAALPLPGDVSRTEELTKALAALADRFGAVDAAYANAGMGLDHPGVEKGAPEEWRRMIDVNVMGVLYTAHAALPHLRSSKGHMLLTGSAAGRREIKGSVYGASKWFVHGFAENLAAEMHEWGGRCTVIAPGMVNTAFFDQPKPDKIQPDDVARAALFALSAGPTASLREIFLMPQG